MSVIDNPKNPSFAQLKGSKVALSEDGETNNLLIQGFKDEAEIEEFVEMLRQAGWMLATIQ
jgi:hypothetical protein